MRRLALCLALFLSPATAYAADGWTAEMQEDEGGPVMVASVSAAPAGDVTPMLSLMCAGDEGVNLRYQSAASTVEPGTEADFAFENESTKVTKHMQFEDMDGAFAAYFPQKDPIIKLLESGDEVVISESNGNYPAQTFILKGSSKAIGTVLKGCKK